MASNISFSSIDETYPIAGRDNDSQGFRDNFAVIKNNFESAKGEIEDLQLNTARVDDANNFLRNNLLNFNLVYYTEEVYEGGAIDGPTALIQFTNGPYQLFQINGDLTFNFADFPLAQKFMRVRVELQNLDELNARYITFGSTEAVTFRKGSSFKYVNVSGNYIPYDPALINAYQAIGTYSALPGTVDPKVIRLPKATDSLNRSRLVFDFYTIDGGSNIYWDFVGLFA
jgi:hypothetical protein